eukprot:TRINITY_DN302_c0_g1_i1.p1 TRINITY_DN302_c0_g1~~TRINITY_DN302_c0_g1_i1.p1  ORF type:complete len:544 (-),score=133.38 TRINITY_DN302_c0_g1_i1:20-1651(-)
MKHLLLLATLLFCAQAAPLWKVFCSGTPLYRGRVDPIVNPGGVSGHSHKVSGGSNFSPAKVAQSATSVFDEMASSSCTTCSIGQVDLTAYWHPDLYYQWPNGTFSLVPNGGLTVYYPSRQGNAGGSQRDPKWKAFPKGFRMLAGNPYRRSFNNTLADRAINYACLSETLGPETNGFPTKDKFCKNGLRGQVWFPMCWDGVNLDSPGHNQHVAYPTGVDGGDCPATHPVRTPGVFFEAFYAVDKFPHGDGVRQPFVWSNGDPTGYGLHGDFLSGWDPEVMQAAIEHPSCDISNTAFGNDVKKCLPLAPYVQETPAGACQLDNRIPLTEDMGLGTTIPALPGCNPLTYGPADAIPCSRSPSQTNSTRYHLKNLFTGKYMTTAWPLDSVITANATDFEKFTFEEIFVNIKVDEIWSGILNEHKNQFASANQAGDRIACNRGSMAEWEHFQWIITGNTVVLKSRRNNKFLAVLDDQTVAAVSLNATDAKAIWELVTPTGGSIGVQNIVTKVQASRTLPPTNWQPTDDPEGSASVLSLLLVCVLFFLF